MIAHLTLLGWEARRVPTTDVHVYSRALDVLIGITVVSGKLYCPITSRPHYRGQECSWDDIRTHELVEVVARADELKGVSDTYV